MNLPKSAKRLGSLGTLLTILLLCGVGCTRRGEYAVENQTSADLMEVSVFIGGHRFMHGILTPSNHKSFSGPIPGSGDLPVEVFWASKGVKMVTNRTTISSDALRKERNVYFSITDTGLVTRIVQQ